MRYTDKNGNNRTSLEIVAEEVFFGDSGNRNTGAVVPSKVKKSI